VAWHTLRSRRVAHGNVMDSAGDPRSQRLAIRVLDLRTASRGMALAERAPMIRIPSSLMILALSLAGGCALSDGEDVGPPPSEGKADDGDHVQATNCELFVDKIVAYQGSHALRGVHLWVKTINARFDDDVVEVGFRHRVIGAGSAGWRDQKFPSFFGAADYFSTSFTVSSDWGHTQYEGALYARTAAGTMYWFKPADGNNFFFDINTHDNVMQAMHRSSNYDSSINAAVSTQRDDLAYFNPVRCY
jgi:hypothetical protein